MSEELFQTDSAAWAVITIHRKQSKQELANKAPKEISHHELIYNGVVQLKRKGTGGLATLREMAAFMTKRGMIPKPKIECLADKGLAPLPKKSHAAEAPATVEP